MLTISESMELRSRLCDWKKRKENEAFFKFEFKLDKMGTKVVEMRLF